jgi:hypothetical protein
LIRAIQVPSGSCVSDEARAFGLTLIWMTMGGPY